MLVFLNKYYYQSINQRCLKSVFLAISLQNHKNVNHKYFRHVTGLKNNSFNAIKVFKTNVTRSQLNGKHNRDRGAGGAGGAMPPPHFSPQMQFLKAFLDHRVTKSCKATELQLKFEDQTAGNRIFKVSVFKISQGQYARTP